MGTRLLATLSVVLFAGLAVAPRCGSGFKSVAVDEPDVSLIDDSQVTGAARVGKNFDPQSVEVLVDAVDLISALGLTPPFSGQSGMVMVGPDLVTVTGFSFDTAAKPMRIDLAFSGLSTGPHFLEVQGDRISDGVSVSDSASFEQVDDFVLAAEAVSASGREGPESAGSEGTLFGATLGESFAAPPVALSGGGELRSGFVEVSEALIAGAP